MESKLAESLKRDRIEAARRLSPEERLQAFANLCRLVAAIARAGEEDRRRRTKPR